MLKTNKMNDKLKNFISKVKHKVIRQHKTFCLKNPPTKYSIPLHHKTQKNIFVHGRAFPFLIIDGILYQIDTYKKKITKQKSENNSSFSCEWVILQKN